MRARELMSEMGQNVTKLLRPLAAKSTTEHTGKILPREIDRLPPWYPSDRRTARHRSRAIPVARFRTTVNGAEGATAALSTIKRLIASSVPLRRSNSLAPDHLPPHLECDNGLPFIVAA
jgi:hypothetical protein